jgi:hypothetical protein
MAKKNECATCKKPIEDDAPMDVCPECHARFHRKCNKGRSLCPECNAAFRGEDLDNDLELDTIEGESDMIKKMERDGTLERLERHEKKND